MKEQISTRETLQHKILSEISARYLIAVALIAFFSILTLIVNYNLHQRMEQDFKIINISGRQRMLSQRIALLSTSNRTAELNISIKEFEDGLAFLKDTRFVKTDYPEIYNHYKDQNGIESLSKEFIALSGQTKASSNLQVFQLSQEILKKFDQVTSLKQQISEMQFRRIIFLEILILIITLTLLALEMKYIFRPIVQRVKNAFGRLNKMEDQSLASARLAMIGEITSTIGHEIKNPLSVILAQAETMKRTNNDEAINKKIESINKNAERIDRIINALSIQARESSQDPMNATPLKKIVDDAVEIFEAKLKYDSINLIRIEQFDGQVICRHAAIAQVIANLLSNAIDSISEMQLTQTNEIKIEAGLENDQLYVRISDSGPGVPQDLKERIFESFITTKKIGKGTGLGLAISKRIMQEHGGDLQFRAEISSSCFEMRFPSSNIAPA